MTTHQKPTAAASPRQAWAILLRHARSSITPLRLQELCNDVDRVNSLVAVHTSDHRILLADLSRQKMTLDTLNHLLRLASARDVRGFVRTLAWGQNDPDNPMIVSGVKKGVSIRKECSPSLHLALRAPENRNMSMLLEDGTNVLEGIHREWKRIQQISTKIRKDHRIRNAVVVGRGVPTAALRFLYHALKNDEDAERGAVEGLSPSDGSKHLKNREPRKMIFVSSPSPDLGDLKPEQTVVIGIAGDEETMEWMERWLGRGKRSPDFVYERMMVVTSNEKVKGVKSEHVFVIPQYCRCDGFTSFTAATLLPLSIVFGWPIASEMLAGGHNMDKHFIETNPRHNLPILLALTDIWNDAFLGSSGRMVTPFSEPFTSYPEFVAALESQTCGRGVDKSGNKISGNKACAALVIDGGLHGTYDRMLYQGGRVLPSELIVSMDAQTRVDFDGQPLNCDTVMCSFFAHADVLAFGTDTSEGNRPSTLLICGRCDAFMCGQLIALAEHRAAVTSKLWDVDPFAESSGSSLREGEVGRLREKLQRFYVHGGDNKEEDGDGDKVSFATATILGHYANRMRERKYTVKQSH